MNVVQRKQSAPRPDKTLAFAHELLALAIQRCRRSPNGPVS